MTLDTQRTESMKQQLTDDRLRLCAAFFAEIHIMPDGTTQELVPLARVERWLLWRDHEIALLMDELYNMATL